MQGGSPSAVDSVVETYFQMDRKQVLLLTALANHWNQSESIAVILDSIGIGESDRGLWLEAAQDLRDRGLVREDEDRIILEPAGEIAVRAEFDRAMPQPIAKGKKNDR